LFADIKGSTGLEENLDPEEARAIVDPALNLMIEATRRYDGYVVQSTGDGIFALFGAPIAHEDHPQRALYAALRMQEDIKRYDEVLLGDGRGPVEIRVGVNTGEVVVRPIETGNGQVEYTPIGHTANLASRMQTLAATGSIALTENTRRLVEGYFALKARGPTRIKGVSEPVQVYEVTGLGPLRTRLQRSAGRGLTKFVGRAREMEMMKATAQLAKEGRGQIVAAVAEAGVGKSRLFYEFKAVSQSGWLVLEAFSISHGKASAYLPVIEMLHAYFDITPADEARRRREKIGGKVLMLDRSLEDTLPYLFSLLGANEGEDSGGTKDPQIRERRTLEAIKRLLLRESLNQPLILIFEDLHWVDAKTLALLNMLADSIGTAKILLLVNYRPEYSHSWGGKTFYTQLRLDPLHKENAEEMIAALLGDDAQLAELKRLIIEKTEGNPFFMEEMVQVLLDEGALVRNGTLRLTKSPNELKIPPTVQGILAARIDRLPQAAKDLLQTLAVIGKEFPLYLVRAVTGMSDGQHARPPLAMRGERPLNDTAEAQLDALLSHLQLGEFIYEQPAQGDIEYTFKHALTQEVAYNSVLIERRRILHERTARAIEQLLSGQSDNHLNELAHHYSRSGNAEKAAEYLQRAGELAMKRWGSIDEAISHLSAAMDLVRALPETPAREQRETDLRMALRALLLYRDE
jgi:predicted ATPase/class 3 adenylate cyclase